MAAKAIRLALGLMAAAMPAAAHARDFAIGDGVTITLGDEWTGKSVENPAMDFAGMREILDEAIETRLRGPGSGVLISYMKFKTTGTGGTPPDDGALIAEGARMAYGAAAEETEIVPTVRSDGDTIRAFVTLRARPGMRFNVAGGYPGGCVTTGSIRKGGAVHSVSVASESCDSPSHQAAVVALFGVAG